MPVAMAVVAGVDAGLRAIELGASVLQLRAPDMSARQLEAEAMQLVSSASIPVLVSSRCDVALAAHAAGVNLPERDISVAGARQLLGDRLVGRSVHSIDSARQAEHGGADFVIFGPIWSGPSHGAGTAFGLEALTAVVRAVTVPVLAIGGVSGDRVAACLAAGAAGHAAISMFS